MAKCRPAHRTFRENSVDFFSNNFENQCHPTKEWIGKDTDVDWVLRDHLRSLYTPVSTSLSYLSYCCCLYMHNNTKNGRASEFCGEKPNTLPHPSIQFLFMNNHHIFWQFYHPLCTEIIHVLSVEQFLKADSTLSFLACTEVSSTYSLRKLLRRSLRLTGQCQKRSHGCEIIATDPYITHILVDITQVLTAK